MYTITKHFTFAAAHHLPSLPPEHKCHRPHGHNYVVEVQLAGSVLNKHGFVVDYGDLGVFGEWIKDHVDHRDLNDVNVFGSKPTAENLAEWFYDVVADLLHPLPDHVDLVSVKVKETDGTSATYYPDLP